MKFIHYLETISGIGIYPFLSLMVFVIFFVSMLFMVLRMDRRFIVSMSNMPLEADPTQTTSNSLISNSLKSNINPNEKA